jgi:DNA-directed RNA polymerase subunit RPC12/RpoP
MGLYAINCVQCSAPFMWFSGTMDQRCDACRSKTMTIKDHVKGMVKFQYFRDNQLFYKTETGLVFPVPVEDTDKGTFLAEDKAMLFMRYIRKFLESAKT